MTTRTDSPATDWPEIEATKLDAARRQLETSIRLLFAEADAISIHTLAFAAFGLLKDVANRRGERRVLDAAEALASRGSKGDFWRGFSRGANFFKHADRDPDAMLTGMPEEENEALISIALSIFADLGCLMTPPLEAFRLWWSCINFQPIDDVQEPFITWIQANAPRLHEDSRQELLALGGELLALLSGEGSSRRSPIDA
jgi:hypothetical protein